MRVPSPAGLRLPVTLLLVVLLTAACIPFQAPETTAVSIPNLDPAGAMQGAADRSVVVIGSTCGDAGGNTGSGIAIAENRVLTAAHVVAGAEEIKLSMLVEWSGVEDPPTLPASVVAFDTLRDLAVVELDSGSLTVPDPPLFKVMVEAEAGTIIGGSTSGDIEFTVTDKTIIEMDEVRGERRSRRSGYLLAAESAPGDSGAGLYDSSGRLTGLLFAVSTEDGSRSWATAADEIQDFLDDESVTGSFVCNPDRSRIERTG